MVKKSLYKAVYMYRSVFMFLVREMNSWPLMLILWYEGRRREAPPPSSSLYGTPLCRRPKEKPGGWQGALGIQAEAPSTLYFLWAESKLRFPSFRFGAATMPLLLVGGVADPATVSSPLPRGYCRDVTSSWQQRWALPADLLPVYSVGGRDGESRLSLPVRPSPRPSRGH